MPRARIIKPDFWSDKNMVKLSPFARLLYIGMWNFAICDHGHLDDDIEELQLKILPRDPVDSEALLEELLSADRVRRMTSADGTTYLWAVRLDKHTKLDERWKTRCPYCAGAPASSAKPPRAPRNSRESPRVPASDVETTETPGPAETPDTHQNSREFAGAPLSSALVRFGKEGIGRGFSGAAPTVTTGTRTRDLEEPPPSDGEPGIAEKILTRWIDGLPARPMRSIVEGIGRHVVDALQDGIAPADITEALRLWQARTGIGPGVLPSIIHDLTTRPAVEHGGNVVPFQPRTADPRPSTTDERVGAALALAARFRAEEEAAE